MNKKSKSRLMAILTILSLVGCKENVVQVEPTESTIIEIVKPETIETTDRQGLDFYSYVQSEING